METTAQMRKYEQYLRGRGLANRTTESYIWVAAFFERTYGTVGEDTLRAYRDWLVQTFKPGTVNQRIQAINCYLAFLGRKELALRSVRVQQCTYLESTISDRDYDRLVRYLRERIELYGRDYCAVRLMVTAGMRVSELLRLRAEHVRRGYLDLHSKGKLRRILIPSETSREVMRWLDAQGLCVGPFLLNRYGDPITSRGLSQQLKARAAECGIDARNVHPHAFRHLFARRFLEAGGDISLLADLLGHSSIDTTRIYLRRTSAEQHKELDRLVSW